MRTLPVFAVLGLAASLQAGEWSQRFEVTGRPELRVEADEAEVTLRAGGTHVVEAHVTTHGWPLGPDGVRVEARQKGARIEIAVRVPRGEWGWGNRSVRLDVTVPPALRAEIRTTDGGIRAQGLKGEFRFTTGDGSIDADALDGALTARTGDGNLNARGRFDELDLHTSDGSVVAALNPGSVAASPWRIETGDGNVTLRLPEGFAAELEATTGDGEISVRVPFTSAGFRNGEHTFRGQLNGGGRTLRIHTGDGSIHVERR
jgi:DUF4097 and DUF4098 domain-containing protein YvlB